MTEEDQDQPEGERRGRRQLQMCSDMDKKWKAWGSELPLPEGQGCISHRTDPLEITTPILRNTIIAILRRVAKQRDAMQRPRGDLISEETKTLQDGWARICNNPGTLDWSGPHRRGQFMQRATARMTHMAT
jgi:hypothetical protein